MLRKEGTVLDGIEYCTCDYTSQSSFLDRTPLHMNVVCHVGSTLVHVICHKNKGRHLGLLAWLLGKLDTSIQSLLE